MSSIAGCVISGLLADQPPPCRSCVKVHLREHDEEVAGRIVVDLDPLRESRDFRLLFAGQLIGIVGSQLTVVAIAFQVYGVTGSSFQVGAVSLAQLVPLIVGALAGGAAGDAMDRRHLLVLSSAVLALASAGLAVNASFAHPSIPAIYLVSALAAFAGGVFSTSCSSAVPSLVEPTRLVAAFASLQVVDQVGMVAAPALSGLLISLIHLAWVYGLVAATYVIAAVTLLRMSPRPATRVTRPGLGSVLEGLRYLRGRQALQGSYLIDLNAMVFGMPRALFPALATGVFHGGPRTLGALYAAPAVGALLGALTTGWLPRIRRQAWAVVVAVCVWGTAIVLFGLVGLLVVALALLAIAGWADVISAVLRSTILQSSVPEAFRSRIASVQIAVVEGGVACVAGAAILVGLLPGFRHYRHPGAEEPVLHDAGRHP